MQRLALLFLLLLPLSLNAQDFDVYVSDAGNFDVGPWQILKFDSQGQNPEQFINTQLAWPQDILFLEDQGVVLISNLNSGRINRHDAETGAFLSTFASGINGPTRMKIGPDGFLYVLQWTGNGLVLRYQLDGTFLGAFTNQQVPQAIGLDWDVNGNLYVSSYTSDYVRRFGNDGSDLGLFISTNLAGPTNIWFDDNGDLLVSDYDGTAVKRFGSNGLFKSNFLTGLSQSEGIDYLPDGDILVGNGATGSVRRFAPNGTAKGDFITPTVSTLMRPNAVVIRQTGPGFEMNAGLNDAWKEADGSTTGQGFFITIFPDLQLASLAWFTYETPNRPNPPPTADLGEPFHRWLTALGPINGNTAELDVGMTSGGIFDDPQAVTTTEPGTYGSITLTFEDCNSGTLDYNLTAIGRQGSIEISRIAGDNIALCEALAEPTE